MKIKNTILPLAATLALTVLGSGCSSIMCGTTQTVPMSTRPPGATVKIANKYHDVVFEGTTPCDVVLSRGDSDRGPGYYEVSLAKDGYAPVQFELLGTVNRAYLANVMNGCIGMVTVDPYTGAKWTLSPTEVNIVLEPEAAK